MRFSVHQSSKIASAAMPRATIEEAITTAIGLMQASPTNPVRIEDYETGKTYRDDDIVKLRKSLDT